MGPTRQNKTVNDWLRQTFLFWLYMGHIMNVIRDKEKRKTIWWNEGKRETSRFTLRYGALIEKKTMRDQKRKYKKKNKPNEDESMTLQIVISFYGVTICWLIWFRFFFFCLVMSCRIFFLHQTNTVRQNRKKKMKAQFLNIFHSLISINLRSFGSRITSHATNSAQIKSYWNDLCIFHVSFLLTLSLFPISLFSLSLSLVGLFVASFQLMNAWRMWII